jgi:2-(1,2-epoxy-1,2-dihydrophenyl)acetyl-CoA isomerase
VPDVTIGLVLGDGPVAELALDRPQQLNTITPEMCADFHAALDCLEAHAPGALVLTGRGRAFSAGVDLTYVRSQLAGARPGERPLEPLIDAWHRVVARVRHLPFPVVTALHGPVVGASMGIALCGDIRVVSTEVRFVPAFLRIGASPDGGATFFLARLLGSGRATTFLVRAEEWGATRARDERLVDEICQPETLLPTAHRIAAGIAGHPARGLLDVRRLMDSALTTDLVSHLWDERETAMRASTTFDYREGNAAFLDRRAAEFRDRVGPGEPR